jgi:6-phosphogluconolactonase
VSRDGRVVVNVNAGSNSISAFAATAGGLRLIGTASSGGIDPNSVAIAADLVYVLNAGSETIAGFRLGSGGLSPVEGSVRPLGVGALVPRQIQFTPDARVLVVAEGGSNTSPRSWSAGTGRQARRSPPRRPAAARSGSTLTGPATCWSPTPR